MHRLSWRYVDTVPYETKIRGFEPTPSCRYLKSNSTKIVGVNDHFMC